MSIELVRILFDFGLVILIMLVQLVIYPSFKYYSKPDLIQWHATYTKRITYVVLPLMLGQLIAASLQIWQTISWYTISSAIIIGLLWLSTFLIFVPLHNKIGSADFDKVTLDNLVNWNWGRTILWIVLFSLSVLEYL